MIEKKEIRQDQRRKRGEDVATTDLAGRGKETLLVVLSAAVPIKFAGTARTWRIRIRFIRHEWNLQQNSMCYVEATSVPSSEGENLAYLQQFLSIGFR